MRVIVCEVEKIPPQQQLAGIRPRSDQSRILVPLQNGTRPYESCQYPQMTQKVVSL
jgi:hypothetical protein